MLIAMASSEYIKCFVSMEANLLEVICVLMVIRPKPLEADFNLNFFELIDVSKKEAGRVGSPFRPSWSGGGGHRTWG